MFITIEGIDGSGKSTQAERIFSTLEGSFGYSKVLWTREPGDWTGGDQLRQLLLHSNLAHPLSELFLFLVDRCEHVATKILPALNQGKIVLCERYTDSTIAYQSWGRGLPRERLENLFIWSGFPVPDLTLWLDISPELAITRMKDRGNMDRIESNGIEFLERVREGYLALMQSSAGRIKRVDASGDIDNVAKLIKIQLRGVMLQ